MVYTIFDRESTNLVGAFVTDEAAWGPVRGSFEAHGPVYIAAWMIEREDDGGANASRGRAIGG